MPELKYKYQNKWVTFTPGYTDYDDSYRVDQTDPEKLLKENETLYGRYCMGVCGYYPVYCYATLKTADLRVVYSDVEKRELAKFREKQAKEDAKREAESLQLVKDGLCA